ncbi:hypothetical protein HDV57DRAFT_331173 [Trichoderma longibrachiatum]
MARVDRWACSIFPSLALTPSSSASLSCTSMHRHRLYQQAGLPLWNHVVNAGCSPAILTSVCFPRWVEHWFWRRERDVPWFVLLTSGFFSSCLLSLLFRSTAETPFFAQPPPGETCLTRRRPARIFPCPESLHEGQVFLLALIYTGEGVRKGAGAPCGLCGCACCGCSGGSIA